MIQNTLDALSKNSSRLAKEAILEGQRNNETLKEVFRLAYGPDNFFIKKIPSYTPKSCSNLEGALPKLSVLSNREKTGNEGIEYLKSLLESLNPIDASTLELIIKKDLRCGVSTSTINKIWPGLIYEVPYMRCSGYEATKKLTDLDWDKGLFSQTKKDGMYVAINIQEDIQAFTRAGSDVPILDKELMNVLKSLPKGYQIQGEFLVLENGSIMPRKTGNGILNSLIKTGSWNNSYQIQYVVWDMARIDSDNRPYSERFAFLKNSIPEQNRIILVETKTVYSRDEALEHFRKELAKGEEGTVLKTQKGLWKDGTSKDQFKVKIIADADLKITGFNPGNGKNEKTFGSISAESSCGLVKVNVSGISDEMRDEIWLNKESYINKIMAVQFNDVIQSSDGSYSLFLPRLLEIRNDKVEADSLDRIKQIMKDCLFKNSINDVPIWHKGHLGWFKNNKRHREIGPAIVGHDNRSYYFEGQEYPEITSDLEWLMKVEELKRK